MAAAYNTPIISTMRYDPSFKVDVRLHEPLLSHAVTQSDIEVDMMTLCTQLELLCKKELSQHHNSRIDHGKVSNSFATKAMVVLDRMEQVVQRLPDPTPTVTSYLEYSGLDSFYPRATAYATHPTDMSLTDKKTAMDGYFSQLSTLNQVFTIANQLNTDLMNQTDHKYIAHQLALLYLSVNSLGNNTSLASLKKNIEDNFKEIKTSLNSSKESEKPRLTPEHHQWILNLTKTIADTVNSLPADLTQNMVTPAYLLSQT